MKRRQVLKMAGASLIVWNTPLAVRAAAASDGESGKIIWLLLRGAMDSLHSVVPSLDRDLKKLRPNLSKSIADTLLPLDRGFGLHPSLANLHSWYKDGDMMPIVAVSSGYGARSHFDGQDYLESGKSNIDHDSGWLGRAIDVRNKRGIAVARATPISLRDAGQVDTWYPSNLKDADEDIYSTILELYEDDEALSASLQSGLNAKNMTMSSGQSRRQGKFVDLAKGCASLMSGDDAPDCAMLELGGWDTHNNQVTRLERSLKELDDGLAEIKKGLGASWKNTTIVVATEFGRTAAENGTKGTDHGTASAMFLAGGAVSGGRVLGEWPGLSKDKLFNERDLQPTSSTFGWLGAIVQQHWGMTDAELSEIFPGTAAYSSQVIAAS